MANMKVVLKGNETNRLHSEGLVNEGEVPLFFDSYLSAFKACTEIINSFEKVKLDSETGNNYNNILAFIGSRGVGKTSLMRNFANMLGTGSIRSEWLTDAKIKGDISKVKPYMEINSKVYFKKLDIIDPTILHENEKLLEYIVGMMFKKFKTELEVIQGRESEKSFSDLAKTVQYQSIVKAFQDTYECFIKVRRAQAGEIDEYTRGSMKALETIAASAELRDKFNELVGRYIEFFAYIDCQAINNRKTCLVIQLDDMDLQTHTVYERSEEIKKFMMVPNVLILINFDLDRYKQVLLNHFLRFNTKLEIYAKSAEYEELRRRVRNQIFVVAQYMDKLFPMDHRVVLPSPQTFPVDWEYVYTDEAKGIPALRAENLEQFTLWPLFEFTRMRYPFSGKANIYIPKNLREIHNYIKTLYMETNGARYMSDKKGTDYKSGTYRHIYDWFASDIIYRWGNENLTRTQSLFLADFWSAPDNHKLLMAMEFYQSKEHTLNSHPEVGDSDRNMDKNTERNLVEFNKDTIAIRRNFDNYFKMSGKKQPTIGDIFYIAQYYEERDLVREGRWEYFSFALLSLISLRLKWLEYRGENDDGKTGKNGGKDEKENIIPSKHGYFGYSSLRLLNVFDFYRDFAYPKYSLAHAKIGGTYVSQPIGRVEYRQGGIDNFDISWIVNKVARYILAPEGDREILQQTVVDYKHFELLFMFMDIEGYEIKSAKAEKTYIGGDKDSIFPEVEITESLKLPTKEVANEYPEENDEYYIRGFKRLTFDVLNPCYRIEKYKETFENLAHKVVNAIYEKSKEIICEEPQTFKKAKAEIILEKLSFHSMKAEVRTNTNTKVMKGWLEAFGLPPVPLNDLVLMYDMIDTLERKSFSRTDFSIEADKFDKAVRTIPEIYKNIEEYLDVQDQKLFAYETKNEPIFPSLPGNKKRRRVYEAFEQCDIIKAIKFEKQDASSKYSYLDYLGAVLAWLFKNRIPGNLRMKSEGIGRSDELFNKAVPITPIEDHK